MLEILGLVVIIAFGLGVLYCLYQMIKYLVDWYIGSKLIEIYKQKDRLWVAYHDLYDIHEDLKESVWDYKDTKSKLKVAMKDIEALEEYVLESNKNNLK